jgi:hypothetical protein
MVRAILLSAMPGITVMIVSIAGGVPLVHSQATDEQQRRLEAALQKLTPAQQQMVRPMLQRKAPSPGGEIHGFVVAGLWEGLELREAALSGAQVFVETTTGSVEEQSVTRTNSEGRFHLSFREPGVYNVCATRKGFAKSCTPVAVVNHNVTLVEPIKLKPEGTAIRGCVTMKDGAPASRNAGGPHESAAAAEVSAEKDGQVTAGPVPVNTAGCYVLPLADVVAGLELVVHYEEAVERQPVPAGAKELVKQAVNVQLQTSPPTIASLTASLGGKEVLQAQPGSTVNVEVKASSPHQYPLRYKWADSTGRVLPGDQPTQSWKLPKTRSLNVIFVEVSDGHGGVARASLPVATGPLSLAEQKLVERFRVERDRVTKFSPRILEDFQHSGTFIDPKLFMGCADEPSCAAEAVNYYKTIGVFDNTGKPTGSYTNFKTWKAAWGFSDDPTKPAASETRGVFYNNGDLQFGRDMHCLAPFGLGDPDSVLTFVQINVCYVANYSPTGAPGGDPQTSIIDAENNSNPIAAVAMIDITNQILLFPFNVWVNAPYVEFIVFAQPNDPNIDDFVPKTEAILDSEGPKAVPGVCLACHGGSYSNTAHNMSGPLMARFLPFDTPSFVFDQVNVPFSAASQSEQFRVLNTITKNASTDGGSLQANTITSQTVRDLVDGWYSWCGGVRQTNCAIDDVNHTFIPSAPCLSASSPATCGWNTDFNFLFYQQVPRSVCRTCHVAHSDAFNWQNFNSASGEAGLACSVVSSYGMPFAEVPYNRFWSSSLDQASLHSFGNCTLNPPPPRGGGGVALLTLASLILLWAVVCTLNRTSNLKIAPHLSKPKPSYLAKSQSWHLSYGFLSRVLLAIFFAIAAHQFSWVWLRFLTSEAVLRISGLVGLATLRHSFDVIEIQGELFQFVTACTFVDVFFGCIPLIWEFNRSLRRNLLLVLASAAALFVFNIVRLEIGQILYSRGLLSYTWADEVLGGCAYWLVWLAVCTQRSRRFTKVDNGGCLAIS